MLTAPPAQQRLSPKHSTPFTCFHPIPYRSTPCLPVRPIALTSARPAFFPALLLAMLPAGLLHAAALAWPGSGAALWWLQIISQTGLCLALLRARTGRQAMALAALFACSWLVGTFWWLFISMHRYGGLAAPLAAAAVWALAAFLSLYYVAAAWVWQRLRLGWQQHRPAWRVLACTTSFTALWLLAELARGQWWTGFPWGAAGYAHVEGPLAALAPWIGVYGIGAVAAALAMLLAQLRWQALRHAASWLLVAGGAGLLWAAQQALPLQAELPTHSTPRFSVALLQGNIAQDEKFQPGSGIPDALDWYGQQLLLAEADLVVAPETAIPLLPQQLDPRYLEQLRQHFTQPRSGVEHPPAALVGIPLGDEWRGYTNSVLGWAAEQSGNEQYQYDKHHLVPFGEFIPPLFKWFTRMMNIPLGDFNRGSLQQAPMHWAGQRLAPNICYEDLFGEELAARFLHPSQSPTVLVNLSNIGWFDDSLAIDQHLHISRMRTLELQRPMLRATNTGATAVIDHRGQVLAQLPNVQRGVLHASIAGRSHHTAYAWWAARWGLWPLWLLGGVLLALSVTGSRFTHKRHTGHF